MFQRLSNIFVDLSETAANKFRASSLYPNSIDKSAHILVCCGEKLADYCNSSSFAVSASDSKSTELFSKYLLNICPSASLFNKIHTKGSSMFHGSDFNPIPALNLAEKDPSHMITLVGHQSREISKTQLIKQKNTSSWLSGP